MLMDFTYFKNEVGTVYISFAPGCLLWIGPENDNSEVLTKSLSVQKLRAALRLDGLSNI